MYFNHPHDPIIDDRYLQLDEIDVDFSQEYPDVIEELDPKFPNTYGKPLATMIFIDSSHANNKETGHLITGCIAFVGHTPVSWISCRQSTVKTSTYSAEFSALRTATKESISIWYMLRSLSIPIIERTKVFGDNLSIILSSTSDSACLFTWYARQWRQR